MKRHLIGIATVVALAAGLAFGQAAATPAKTAKLGARLRQRMLKNLNLTADQKAQAKEIMQTAKTAVQPIRQQLQAGRKELATAVKNGDATQIQALSEKQGALQGQALAVRSGAMAKFYAILTPDQKAKAEQMQQRAKRLIQQLRALGNG
jgi:Spy/CpxP family protein refolding chaperone